MYYLHFIGEEAVRQLEIHTDKRLRYTAEHPYDDDGGLYDQDFSDIECGATHSSPARNSKPSGINNH